MRTKITNLTLLTMDDEQPVITSGSLVIADDRIEQVAEQVDSREPFDRVIDGSGKLALPGLINTHCHVGMIPFRNFANDLPLETWLFEHILPLEAKLTGDDLFWLAQLGIAEMIQTGTTCFADMYWFSDVLAEVVAAVGIRADLSQGLMQAEDAFDLEQDRNIAVSRRLVEQYHRAAGGRITVRLGPHSVYTCSPGYLEAVAELAQKFGVGLHIHLSETARENEDCQAAYGRSPTRHLAELGVLSRHTIAAHGVHLSPEDRAVLSEHDVSISHNPSSNLKLGSGVARVTELMEHGVNVSLGTDGVSSNNNLDMFRAMYLAALLSKGVFGESVGVDAAAALQMASVNGAYALGRADIGRLKPGAKADVIVLDLDKPHYYPIHDPIAAVVYAGHGCDVDTVMVDGQMLYENGEYTTIDLAKVKHEVTRVTQDLFTGR